MKDSLLVFTVALVLFVAIAVSVAGMIRLSAVGTEISSASSESG
jgi:hypothetical protein